MGQKRLRRLAVLVLLIVIVVHIIAGLGAGIWVVARFFAKPPAQFIAERRVETKPEDIVHKESMDQLAAMQPRRVYNNRIQSLTPSKLALPDLPKAKVEAIIPVDMTPVVAAPGVGSANGNGAGGAGQGGGGFFGGTGVPGSGLFEGTFYDLKQNKDGKPTNFAFEGIQDPPGSPRIPEYDLIVRRFGQNWNESILSKYFVGPAKLYTTQFSIPLIDSRDGPKQFHLGGSVKTGYWLAHYTGRVIAPMDGQFRFVGAGDNVLLVRFNGRNVLDGSLDPIFDPHLTAKRYRYANLVARDPRYDRPNQGNVEGKVFTVKKGEAYDMEILIGEGDGGKFTCTLMIEQIGVTYAKDARDCPILPFFKQKASDLERHAGNAIPPSDPNAPIWLPAPMTRKIVPLP